MKLIISGLIISLILTGCSSEPQVKDDDTNQQMMNSTVESESSDESTKTEELKETVGSGESMAFSPYTSTAKVTFIGDDIIDVEFEEFLEDGTSKNIASKAGTYTSPNYTKGEFYEQVDSLEAYIIENDKFPKLSNGTDIDGVSGASINLSGFEEAYSIALQDSK